MQQDSEKPRRIAAPMRHATPAQPLKWGGRWGSNPRPLESQSRALPAELRPPPENLCQVARPTGLEPATVGLEGRCSIRLSYGRIVSRIIGTFPSSRHARDKRRAAHRRRQSQNGRGRGIRTPDILLPKQARYQTALYPVDFAQTNRAAIILSELTYVKHF